MELSGKNSVYPVGNALKWGIFGLYRKLACDLL